MVTLSHSDIPLAIALKYHGWINKQVIDLYVRYALTLFENYKDEVRYWIPFNEINDMFLPMSALGQGGFDRSAGSLHSSTERRS